MQTDFVVYNSDYPYQFTFYSRGSNSTNVIRSWTFEEINGSKYDSDEIGDSKSAPLNDWFKGISKGKNPTMVVLRRVERNSSEPANLGRKLMIRTGKYFKNLTELPGQDITDKYEFGYISDDGNKIVVNEKINDSHTRGVIFAFSNEWKNDRTLDNPTNTNSSFINLGNPDASVLVGESRNDNNSSLAVVWAARNNWTPIILSSWQGDNLGNQIKQISSDGNTLFGISAINDQENATTVWKGEKWQNKYRFTTFVSTDKPAFMKMTDNGDMVAIDKTIWSYSNNEWSKTEFEHNILSMTNSGRFVITEGEQDYAIIIYAGENWHRSKPKSNDFPLSQMSPISRGILLNSVDTYDTESGSGMVTYFAIHDPTSPDDNFIAMLPTTYSKPYRDNGNQNGSGTNDDSGNNNANGGQNGTDNDSNSGNDKGNGSQNSSGNDSNSDNNKGNDSQNSSGNDSNSDNDNGNEDQNIIGNNGTSNENQETPPLVPPQGEIHMGDVVKINVPNTQKSILKMGHDTFELFSLQFGALRRLQEECVAGKGEVCYALQHNYAAQNGNYDNALNLRVGYGFTENLTFGVNFDRSLRRSLPDTYRRLSGNGGVGVFGHYQLPYNAYIAAGIGWDYYRIQAQRPLLANTEFAPTKSRVRGLAWNVTVGQDFTLSNDSQLGWYLAYRQTEIKRDGYRENVPGFPVEYGAANLKDNAIAIGAKFALPITPKLSWISAVEFERRLGGESPVYSAKAQYVGDVRYQPDLNHSRWNAQSGLRYAFAPNLSLSLTPFWGNSIVGNNQWGTKLTLEGRF